jgi:hypothetical protein
MFFTFYQTPFRVRIIYRKTPFSPFLSYIQDYHLHTIETIVMAKMPKNAIKAKSVTNIQLSAITSL